MGKKCIPGVFCIENMTLFILLFIVVILLYVYYVYFLKSAIVSSLQSTTNVNTITPAPVIYVDPPVYQNPALYGISTRTNGFNDPYAPPLKVDTGFYYPPSTTAAVLDVRTGIPILNVPINIPTQGPNQFSNYTQLGIITKISGDKSHNDAILPLMGRQIMGGSRDKWQYYTMTNTGNLNTKLPIRVKGRNCTGEYGCDEIYNNDPVFVEGYDHMYRVTMYLNNQYNYIPVVV
jgi:hypothetical protein